MTELLQLAARALLLYLFWLFGSHVCWNNRQWVLWSVIASLLPVVYGG
ncbi:hypothetical protein SynA1562_01873 [Synechococcus sp. A15-62]|nr:hypothetical protein SynA1562_01873 [Synechococcus sp. A15-62]